MVIKPEVEAVEFLHATEMDGNMHSAIRVYARMLRRSLPIFQDEIDRFQQERTAAAGADLAFATSKLFATVLARIAAETTAPEWLVNELTEKARADAKKYLQVYAKMEKNGGLFPAPGNHLGGFTLADIAEVLEEIKRNG